MPAFLIRQHDEVDQAHDLLKLKALDHGSDQRWGQVKEVELQRLVDASGPHGELSVRVLDEEESLFIKQLMPPIDGRPRLNTVSDVV